MPLTDSAIRNAKPNDKPYKLADGAPFKTSSDDPLAAHRSSGSPFG